MEQKKIYLISPDRPINNLFITNLECMLSKFHRYLYAFQLRIKDKKTTEKAAPMLFDICKKYNVAFIINDFFDIAQTIDADGIHFGDQDSVLDKYKNCMQNKIIGVSCYNDIKRALFYKSATYVSFGCFFKSNTKPAPKAFANPFVLQSWKRLAAKKKCVAIGGITAENFLSLLDFGADIVAVCSYIWQSKTPVLQLEKMVKMIASKQSQLFQNLQNKEA